MAQQNYEVTFAQFGAYPKGSILPKWVLERTCGADVEADIAHLVERGVFRETTQPVNVTLSVPEPKTSGDPMADLVRENNALRADLKKANDEAAAHRELAAIHKDKLDGREKALAKLTDDAAYWQKRAEDAEALIKAKYEVEIAALREEVAEFKASLEAATHPTPLPPVKKTKSDPKTVAV